MLIAANESEHPEEGEEVFAVGWGRMCDKPGQCKQQNKQPQILQVYPVRTHGAAFPDSRKN